MDVDHETQVWLVSGTAQDLGVEGWRLNARVETFRDGRRDLHWNVTNLLAAQSEQSDGIFVVRIPGFSHKEQLFTNLALSNDPLTPRSIRVHLSLTRDGIPDDLGVWRNGNSMQGGLRPG